MFSIAGQDSIWAYPVYLSDGREYMCYVGDTTIAGTRMEYGNVYVSGFGGYAFDADSLTRLSTYWSVQDLPSMATYEDNLYIVNGTHKGLVWNGSVVRSFPLSAPGEMEAYPVGYTGTGDDTLQTLTGQYRYAVICRAPNYGGVGNRWTVGYISQPVRTKDSRVILTGFQHIPTNDSLSDSIGTLSGWRGDSVTTLWIYRTKANPGYLDQVDSLWNIDSFSVFDTTTDLASKIIIDSIPDDSLGIAPRAIAGHSVYAWHLDTIMVGKDSLNNFHSFYGAPRFVSSDLRDYDTASAGHDTANYGIFYGIPEQKDTLGFAYMCTFIDTVTGLESDSSRSYCVFNATDGIYDTDSAKLMDAIQLALPRIPDGKSGLVINLYRGLIYQITYDTGAYEGVVTTGGVTYNYLGQQVDPADYYVQRLAVDTVVITDYFLLAQIPSVDSLFIDTIRYDSLKAKRRFQRSSPPSLIDNLFSYDGKMFGTQGSGLYYSRLDSAYAWSAFNSVAVNPDDGDEAVIAFPTQGGIVVCKNKSAYIAYQDANGTWSESEVSGLPGCIAPQSYAKGFGGHYYLSDYGVVRINDGQFLDRRHTVDLASKTLSNFDDLPIATKRAAVGMYIPGYRQYLLSIGDTTYVYDERADGWTTWGFAISSAGMYGVEDNLQFVPGDTMYFTKPGDIDLYRYASDSTDNDTVFLATWKSAPLWVDEWYEHINAVGVWSPDMDANDSIAVYIYGEDGSASKVGTNIVYILGAVGRYSIKTLNQRNFLMQSLGIENMGGGSGTEIDGLDIFFTRQGVKVRD
jgi:hypothetical protein